MKETIRSEKKQLLILFGLVTLIVFLIWLPSLVSGRPITYGTDLKPQWYQFYYEFDKLICNFISNHQLPFYSWDIFLGNNFYASKGYYMIGDIYAYIGLIDWHFISGNFFDMARNITALKFYVSAFLFYLFLSELDRKPTSKIICSLAYAFSGWAVFYSGQLVFLSFYSFVPLFLIGIERFIKKKKWLIFVLSTALLFSTNFYFFYTLSAFTPIYFLYRYFANGKSTKELFKNVITIILYYILGASLSAFVWLPSIIYVLGSSRFGSSSDYGIFYTYKSNLYALVSMLTPNYLIIYRNNIFESGSHVEREICMYASATLSLLIPQFFKMIKGIEKKFSILFYVIFLLLLTFTPLASFIHGLSDPYYRWTFMLIIINLINISYVLDRKDLIDKKLLSLTSIVYSLVLLTSFFTCLLISKENLNDYYGNLLLFIIFVCVLLVSPLILSKNKNVLIAAVALELGLSVFYNYQYDMKAQPDITYSLFDAAETNLGYYPNQLNDTLNGLNEENSKEFYRIYIPYDEVYWSMSQNASTFFNLKGVMTYDSSLNTAFRSMSYAAPAITYGCSWIIDIKDQNLLDFLSVKYAVTTKDFELNTNIWKLVKDDYLDTYYIYENSNYRPIGKTSNSVYYKELTSEIDNTNRYLNSVVVNDDKSLTTISSMLSTAEGYLYDIEAMDNHLYAKYTSDNNGFMVTSIPYDKGWKLMIDGSVINYFNINGGFIGFEVNEGIHNIEMYFMPQGFKEGVIITAFGMVVLCVSCFLNKKISK